MNATIRATLIYLQYVRDTQKKLDKKEPEAAEMAPATHLRSLLCALCLPQYHIMSHIHMLTLAVNCDSIALVKVRILSAM